MVGIWGLLLGWNGPRRIYRQDDLGTLPSRGSFLTKPAICFNTKERGTPGEKGTVSAQRGRPARCTRRTRHAHTRGNSREGIRQAGRERRRACWNRSHARRGGTGRFRLAGFLLKTAEGAAGLVRLATPAAAGSLRAGRNRPAFPRSWR